MQTPSPKLAALRGSNGENPPWERVVFAPPAAWADAEERYDAAFRGGEGGHVTQLLWSWQAEAESGCVFHSSARRLESPVGVSHESLWSVDIDARVGRGHARTGRPRVGADQRAVLAHEPLLVHHAGAV